MKNKTKIVSLVALFGLTLGIPLQVSHGMDGWTESPDLNPTLQTSPKATSLKRVPLTSITKRCEILGNYYREDINNPDPSVFIHLAKWHNQDAAAIRQKITNPENLPILNQCYAAINQSFSKGNLSHCKLAIAYWMYAGILTADMEPSWEFNATENDYNIVLQYIQDGIDPEVKETSIDDSDLEDIFTISSLGIKLLPFVSKTGYASYRAINEGFGLNMPLLGLPLERSDYDGNFDQNPMMFYTHDVNHLFLDNRDLSDLQLTNLYNHYKIFNSIIRDIKEKKTQYMCDAFLFVLGHEEAFEPIRMSLSLRNNLNFSKTDFAELNFEDFSRICDTVYTDPDYKNEEGSESDSDSSISGNSLPGIDWPEGEPFNKPHFEYGNSKLIRETFKREVGSKFYKEATLNS